MKGLSDLMKQAQAMQKSIEATQQELINYVVTGVALAGDIRVKINGKYDCLGIEMSDNLLKQSKIVIQDAVAAAYNDAAKKIEEYSKSKMSNLMAGVNLPTDFDSLT
ncbi:MAG: YbaB/EbfC family nucleoid-associated protein [Gammaproteobacteria bacterium]|nr:YbaB/EbfC family nucleoid-associated protein [Gammaproteobacteria bacterium]